ncbi:hypothetical protein IRY61_03615 [Candidatus Saccharibacteria bacterium]|nr:hypothetical protein [Candidatus Saccharibacteria bacterium]
MTIKTPGESNELSRPQVARDDLGTVIIALSVLVHRMWPIDERTAPQFIDYDSEVYIDSETRRIYENPN